MLVCYGIIQIFLIIFQLLGLFYIWQADNIILTNIIFIILISIFIFCLSNIEQKNFVIFSIFINITFSNVFIYEDYISAVFLLSLLIIVYKKTIIKKKSTTIIMTIIIVLTIISFIFYTINMLISCISPSNIFTINRQLTVIEHKSDNIIIEYYDVSLYKNETSIH
jgi:hypothetical protein